MLVKLFAVECPSGTYYLQGLCEVCPIGTYQDEMGKTYCKTCPSGYTTQFVASQSSTACSGNRKFDLIYE